MPATSGASGPTTTRSTPFSRQNPATASMVGDIEVDALGAFGDAGIARRGEERAELRRLGDLPGQRMLAPAGTDEKDVHAPAESCVAEPGARLATGAAPVQPNHILTHRRTRCGSSRPGTSR